MRFVSLFSGIGGMDLGLERAGWECVAQVEWDDHCNRVLEKHWPDTPRWRDIHDVTPKDLPDCDAIVGGFPCQPVSLAGSRLAQDDPRWLWPEFLRIIRHLRPRYVIVENVPGLASAGMGDVLGDLAEVGYDAEWQSVPAAAVGAPHLRWRFFIVAYPASSGDGTDRELHSRDARSRRRRFPAVSAGSEVAQSADAGAGGARSMADADQSRRRGRSRLERSRRRRQSENRSDKGGAGTRRSSHALSDADSVTDGHGIDGSSQVQRGQPTGRDLTGWWAIEPDVGRVAHGIPRRVDRLRGLGNAVVPQVAEWIGRMINRNEQTADPDTRAGGCYAEGTYRLSRKDTTP